jgi:hypothetical protein
MAGMAGIAKHVEQVRIAPRPAGGQCFVANNVPVDLAMAADWRSTRCDIDRYE